MARFNAGVMTMTERYYHGIIVKESIRDRSLFAKMQVLGQSQGRDWTLLKVGVRPNVIVKIINEVQSNLLTEKDVPF